MLAPRRKVGRREILRGEKASKNGLSRGLMVPEGVASAGVWGGKT